MLSSSLSSPFLFDPDSLEKIIKEVRDDSQTSIGVAVSKFVSLPSFSAMRSARVASSSRPAAGKDQVGQGAGRGRGKVPQHQAQAAGKFKRKASSSPAPGSSSGKSPKRFSRSPKGRGFPQ